MEDYNDFPGGASPQQLQRPPQQPPPPDIPWTTNDDISLAKHNQYLATANGLLDDGELSPEEHQHFMQQIMPRLNTLQQRQQKSQQQAEQKGIQQAMHQTAQQEAMMSENMKFRAGSFQGSVASFTDPVTGETEHFYPDQKGNWKPIEFVAHNARQELVPEHGQADPSITYPPTRAMQSPAMVDQASQDVGGVFDRAEEALKPPGEPPQLAEKGPPTPAEAIEAAQQASPPGQPVPLEKVAQALGGQPPTPGAPKIMNALGEEARPASQVQQRDEWGRPTGPPPGAAPHVMAEFRRRAEQTFPRPNVSGLPPAQAAHVLQNWEGQIQSMVTHQMTQKERTEEHQRHETAMVAERQRKEAQDAKDAEETRKQKQQDRVDLAKQKQQERLDLVHERLTKEKTLTEQQDMQHIKEISDDVRREHTEAAKEYKNDNSKEIPEEIATPAARHAEIIKRFKERKEAMQELRQGKKPEGVGVPGIGDGLGAGAAGGTEEGAVEKPKEKLKEKPPPTPRPDGSKLTTEEKALPTKVPVEKVDQLLQHVQNGLNAIPMGERVLSGRSSSPLMLPLTRLRQLLLKAKKEGRTLNVGESLEYMEHQETLHDLLKDAGGAHKLRLGD